MLKRILILCLAVVLLFMSSLYYVNAYAKEKLALETTDTIETKLNIHFDSALDKTIANVNSLHEIINEDLDQKNIYNEKSSEVTIEIRMPKEFAISKSEAKIYAENHFKNEIEKLSNLFDVNPDIDDVNF